MDQTGAVEPCPAAVMAAVGGIFLPCVAGGLWSWSMEAADHCGALKHDLKTQGTPIGEMDTRIAAHALSENLILVTHNTRNFERISGLMLEDWMS